MWNTCRQAISQWFVFCCYIWRWWSIDDKNAICLLVNYWGGCIYRFNCTQCTYVCRNFYIITILFSFHFMMFFASLLLGPIWEILPIFRFSFLLFRWRSFSLMYNEDQWHVIGQKMILKCSLKEEIRKHNVLSEKRRCSVANITIIGRKFEKQKRQSADDDNILQISL